MSNTTQVASKKQAQLQQQLAKRQQALAKIERDASLSNKKAQIDVAKAELEKARIDLLNAKIQLNEVPSEDKVGQLYARAEVKEAEAKVLKGRAQLYSQQDELKALKASFIEAADEDELDDNIDPAFDIAFQKMADILNEQAILNDEPDDNTEPSEDIASTLTETSVSQLEDSIMDYLTMRPEPPESEMLDFEIDEMLEIESADTILDKRILGHVFKTQWPNDYEMSNYATIDMTLDKAVYCFVITTEFENRFYLHVACFSVKSYSISDSEYFREVYKTKDARDRDADNWLFG